MKKLYTATLGCKINQYETQAIVEAWSAGGYVPVSEAKDADTVLVNSCAVTARAVSDLRATVRRINRENPGAAIVVTGCAAQVLADEIAELPGVVKVVPQQDKAELLAPAAHTFSISDYPRARAVVMVQDGCSHGCTYCIVPLTRGPAVSRKPEEVLGEMDRLLTTGFRELIFSGVNLRQYGRDLDGGPGFWKLMRMVEERFAGEWAGRARLRISSLEPGQLGDEALQTIAASKLICPQLHLSLQAGDPDVLKAMGRGHYRAEQALEFCDRLASIWPVFGLGADILTGFPTETEAQFENTLAFVEKLPLSYAHVFPYSVRPGTRAVDMADQVPPADKKRRARVLRETVEEKQAAFLRRLAGLDHLDVLVQDESGKGVSEYYAACRFAIPPARLQARDLVRVRPVGVEENVVLVEPAGEAL